MVHPVGAAGRMADAVQACDTCRMALDDKTPTDGRPATTTWGVTIALVLAVAIIIFTWLKS